MAHGPLYYPLLKQISVASKATLGVDSHVKATKPKIQWRLTK